MSNEKQAQLEMARDCLRAAETLLAGGLARNAANPAYMAMEHAASAMLLSRGGRYSKHEGVQAQFGQLFSKTQLVAPKFHRYLLDAFKLRHNAEYEAGLVIADEDVEGTLKNAREFLTMAEDFITKAGG